MRDVIGIGRALVDCYIKNNNLFPLLTSLNDGNNFHHQLTNEEAENILFNFSPENFLQGGSIANTIVHCSKLEIDTTFSGSVGKDLNGDIFISSIQKSGVLPLMKYYEGCHTGFTLMVDYPKINRRYNFFYYGASDFLEHENTIIKELSNHRILYSSAYEFVAPLGPVMKRIFTEFDSRESDRMKVINLGGYSKKVLRKELHELDNLLNQKTFDIIIGNEEECCSLFNVDVIDDNVVKKLRKIAPINVITLAENGSMIIGPSFIHKFLPYKNIRFPINVIGVGDMYSAGFLTSIILDDDLVKAGYEGCYQAFLKIEQTYKDSKQHCKLNDARKLS